MRMDDDAQVRSPALEGGTDGELNIAINRQQDNRAEAMTRTDGASGLRAVARFSPEWNARRERVFADLRAQLDRMGLSDVALRLPDRIDLIDGHGHRQEGARVLGRSVPSLIEIALAPERDHARTMRHEAIHALRGLGLFRQAEWSTLERAARADTARMAEVRSRYQGQRLDDAAMVEEAVADMFADWAAGRSQTRGFIRTAFERIREFLRALRSALAGQGFTTPESVFRAIDRGEVGQRPVSADGANVRFTGKFALATMEDNDPTAPGGAQKRQQGMFDWLTAGQPIDRAIRLPFNLFGGINSRGEWEWGRALLKRDPMTTKSAVVGAGAGFMAAGPLGIAPGAAIGAAAGKIMQAKFSKDGRFAWANNALEAARAGLIDRYGLDPAYVERDRQRGLDERRVTAQIPEIMQALKAGGVGSAEAKVLQALLTGEDAVADADMHALAEPIRNAIDSMGQEAVQLGLISAESFERNRGAYLHRVYLKHESEIGGIRGCLQLRHSGATAGAATMAGRTPDGRGAGGIGRRPGRHNQQDDPAVARNG